VSSSARRDSFGLVGSVLQNEYRVDAVVGEGGFGVVYRGFHLGLEQPIAIKVLKGLELEDRRMQDLLFAKFRDEAKLLYTLSQQSLAIVRSMDFGALTTPSGAWAPFMVLEWLEGCSLAEDLDARRAKGLGGRTLEEAFAILAPGAEGLSVAHNRQVAHRDIKPANFFLPSSPDGPRLKVLDFGIAKMMKEGEEAGTRGTFASFTWLYATPEQLDPRLGKTGLRTDVYAFALVLTELLTGARPVDARNAVAILKAATDHAVRPTPRTRGAQNIPDGIEDACRRALSVDPAARFANVPELWTALTAAQRTAAAMPRSVTIAVPARVGPSGSHPAAPAPRLPTAFAPTHTPARPPIRTQGQPQPPTPSWSAAAMSPPLGTAPPGQPVYQTGSYRQPLPPRPAETSSVVSVFVVLFVLAILLAGSCAALHAAC
jgi:eukaryotic-like serine/threonine-protein kinase